MLQIKHIRKEYRTKSLTQTALDDVSISFRDSEFVAILGPSGSGKTTLLNVIGGLDRYDSGDLIINGLSTRHYRDSDWDYYRAHTIGFVFQSYNLIPHQSVLANVELALTIAGISRRERRERAVQALEKVGLGDQIYKKPNQMSGGQMQRVAIARALVNDPDIVLADEPTGALDSRTSIQVMELLKEVAKDRLVIMVTHNPDLAARYATRTVRIKDGKIIDDTNPLTLKEEGEAVVRKAGHSSMSFLTALSLSFNNLRTKKARTLLVSIAGSIGIIGIALVMALSNGATVYINDMERQAMGSYPLQISSVGYDLSSMMSSAQQNQTQNKERKKKADKDTIGVSDTLTSAMSTMSENDLSSLKKYIDSGKLGRISRVNVWANFNYAAILNPVPDTPVPEGVDFEMWLGPAPERTFNPKRFHGSWRMFWDYGGGLVTDWGVHLLDMALWGMNVKGMPKRVFATGGNFTYPDNYAETFDTLSVIYEFEDFLIQWSNVSIESGPYGKCYGLEFKGTNGTLVANREGWEVIPEQQRIEAETCQPDNLDRENHVSNFLDCMRRRDADTACTIENGSFCAKYAHIGNISARVGEPLTYDDARKTFHDRRADRLITPEYRKPWKFPKF